MFVVTFTTRRKLMQPIFILIRGNSGSGKSTLATSLQEYFGYQQCLLLHEDILRLDILHAKENISGPTASLIELMTILGGEYYPITILEGILPKSIYEPTLTKLIHRFGSGAYVYYLDVPFAQTLINNSQKQNPFPTEVLQKWWLEDDTLGINERKLTNGTVSELTKQILSDIQIGTNKKDD